MSVRLNKATKECNVGLQTAVEFLQKKGFTDVEVNPNSRITDEQYEMLLKEFSPDKGLRKEATEMQQQRQTHKEKEKERRAAAKHAAAFAAAEIPCRGTERRQTKATSPFFCAAQARASVPANGETAPFLSILVALNHKNDCDSLDKGRGSDYNADRRKKRPYSNGSRRVFP